MCSSELLQGDCLELMKGIPDGTVDLILCDLPYGMTDCKWDSALPLEQLWAEYKRVIKPGAAIVLFAIQPFSSALVMSNPKWFRNEWIWRKEQGTGWLNSKKQPLRNHEQVLVFAQKTPTYNPQMRPGKAYQLKGRGSSEVYNKKADDIVRFYGAERYPLSVVEFRRDRGFHPTQKPVALTEYLVRTYSNEGDTVLDNCMGSGTTGIACIKANRNFIGMEKDPSIFKVASNRIQEFNTNIFEVSQHG